jgi:hypothetical protein
MAPKLKVNGNLDMPKRSCKVLLLCENIKVLNKERKQNYMLAKICGKNGCSIMKL